MKLELRQCFEIAGVPPPKGLLTINSNNRWFVVDVKGAWLDDEVWWFNNNRWERLGAMDAFSQVPPCLDLSRADMWRTISPDQLPNIVVKALLRHEDLENVNELER